MQGPGRGITMDDGTLVFPTQGRDKTGMPFSNITYSRDGGSTWIASNPAYHNICGQTVFITLPDRSLPF